MPRTLAPTLARTVPLQLRLAQQLPPPLVKLFAKHPPPQLRAAVNAAGKPSTTSTTSSSDPHIGASAETSKTSAADAPDPFDKSLHNPFLPYKNPKTGNWHGPAYSLRRQADLFKLAKLHHVLPLMPISPKHPEVKEQKRIERALRMQGTGEGPRVKGKLWERQLRGKLEERRKAMEGMPEMVKLWKQRGHGRGWKKWPK